MKDPVFEPIMIGELEVKNRIYMPAMHLGMAEDYQVNDRIVAFYKERAIGGAGAICVGYATVDDLSGNTQCIGAHKDEFIPGLTKLSDAIKEGGSRSVIQLNHSGRYNYSFFTNGKTPVAPSPIASRLTREEPREMTKEDIDEVIKSFGEAALRSKNAGFDAVEVLNGTGYLISEFLSHLTNQRTDEYGGSYENRMRFGLEVMREVRKKTGGNYPIIVRMNGNDFMEGGQGREELKEYAKALVKENLVDALCINVGWHEARVPQIVTSVPRGAFAYLAKGMKEIVDVPVIASHRINDPALVREVIGDGLCDMVAMGRSLIADPYLPEKARTGKEDELVHCTACAQGCFDNLFKLKPVECLCNPKAGYENELNIEKTDSPRKVVIVGGGAAGMSAALAASEKGHDVSLYERNNRLGGQLHLAGAPPGREEFAVFADDLSKQIEVSDVKVFLNKEVDEKTIEQESPDEVILTTGAVSLTPKIPGYDKDHVVQAWDVLSGKAYVGKNVVVIGGGAVGVETSLYLAEKGTLSGDMVKFLLVNKAEPEKDLYEMSIKGSKNVTVIEMIDKIGKDIGKSTRWSMLQDLSRFGIDARTNTKAVEIKDGSLVIEIDGNTEEIQADTVVLAAGSVSYNPLEKILTEKSISCKVIGDANKIALAFDAVHDGFAAGNSI
ncbi:MAG: FAD-dependent oxidoreductase [Desulfobacterales bacterium]|nr:FAD-dependent oxidoreductase [Desulfobacterales bacterium]